MVGNTANFSINVGYTGEQIDAIDTVNTYFNYDFTSFTNATNPVVGVCLIEAGSNDSIVCESSLAKGIVEIPLPATATGEMTVELKMTEANGARNRYNGNPTICC